MECIRENELLSKYCSYKTGGPTKYFAEPTTNEELIETLQWKQDQGLKSFVMGLGSNILFSDKGFDGLVISLRSLNKQITINQDFISAGAGIVLDNLIKFSLKNGFIGMENLSGIPGCIGGNIFMNAGAFATEMKDIVYSVKVLNKNLKIINMQNHEIGFSYRRTEHIKEMIVLEADFKLKFDSNNFDGVNIRKSILEKRLSKQPLDYPSCGSVFKRPEGNYAGTLIENCGLKGFSIGGATVAEKHANFIINANNASSSDIYNLIQHVKKVVKTKTGIMLQEEVKLIGF